jgi:hypothetical protein
MTQTSPEPVDLVRFPDRIDMILLRDFIVRTSIPWECSLLGYGTFPTIHYSCVTRFGETAGPLVRPALDHLVKEGLIVTGPHTDSWRLAR